MSRGRDGSQQAGKSATSTRPLTIVGHSPNRVDAAAKVAGATRYIADESPAGALYAAVVTSPLPRARIDAVQVEEAMQVPGVHAVLTHVDVPGDNQIGVVKPDQPLLVQEQARCLSDRIALVAAQTPEAAREAARKVRVQAEPLPTVFDVRTALSPGAPKLHPEGNLCAHMKVRKGCIDEAAARADLVIQNTYTTGHQEHAYLETNGIIALPHADGSMLIRGSMQCPFYVQKAVARVLGVPQARVRVVQAPTGGGFGGKEDYPSEPAACAALLARATGRPVKLVYRRDEDVAWSSKRHAMTVEHTLYARRDGTLLGLRAAIYVDAGAYAGLSDVVAQRSNSSAGGPYRIAHVHVDTYTVYTNNPFGGAFRGFGAPQVTFALESQMDLLAEAAGLDPVQVRQKSFVGKGSRTATDQRLKEPPLAEQTLSLAVRRSRYRAKKKELDAHNAGQPDLRRGIGIASMSYGCCLHAGGQHLEGSAAWVQVHGDASVSVSIGGTELGQGAFTVVAQLAAETLGLPLANIHVTETDTATVPDSGPTVASRTTVMSGNAVLDAARQIRARMVKVAAATTGVAADQIDLRQGWVYVGGRKRRLSVPELVRACHQQKVNLSQNGWYAPPRKRWDDATGRGEAYSFYCYGATVAEVSVDTITGLVKVDRVTAVHDVGRAIHRAALEGQIQGGVAQGVGYATLENLVVREGRIHNNNFTDYLIPTAMDVPEVDVALIEEPYSAGPFGAKGVGEPSLIPVAAAVANAVAHALGMRLHDLPLTPERVKMAWVRLTHNDGTSRPVPHAHAGP